jgi:SAM-dependent methyltransferase
MKTSATEQVFACRLCGYTSMIPAENLAFEMRNMPSGNHRLLSEGELEFDDPIDLKVFCCQSCGFVSVPMELAENYYEGYVNVPSTSVQSQEFQLEQATEFVHRFGLQGSKVLEVGCGDGYFLKSLVDLGVNGYGLEPSSVQRGHAEARDLNVEGGILAEGRILPNAPFDAFVTRQVFEHVEDMRDFLLTIRLNLRVGGVGLIEVPNLSILAQQERFFDFIPEHVNYFTPNTLGLALQFSGFSVVDVVEVQDGESLRAIVKWEGHESYSRLPARIETLREQLDNFLDICDSENKTVAIWGAGGKGLSMMAVCNLSRIKLLVDSDAGKIGRYTPIKHIRVEAPAALKENKIDVVVVMAPVYEKEIARRLVKELQFAGEIVLAGRGFETLSARGNGNG